MRWYPVMELQGEIAVVLQASWYWTTDCSLNNILHRGYSKGEGWNSFRTIKTSPQLCNYLLTLVPEHQFIWPHMATATVLRSSNQAQTKCIKVKMDLAVNVRFWVQGLPLSKDIIIIYNIQLWNFFGTFTHVIDVNNNNVQLGQTKIAKQINHVLCSGGKKCTSQAVRCANEITPPMGNVDHVLHYSCFGARIKRRESALIALFLHVQR